MLPLNEIIASLKDHKTYLDDRRKALDEKLKEMKAIATESESLADESLSIGFAIARLENLSSKQSVVEEPEVLNESTWGDIENVR